MRAKLRPAAAVVVLTILIATVGTLALWLVGSVISPVGAVTAVVAGHPVGAALAYGFSALIAIAIVNRDHRSDTLP